MIREISRRKCLRLWLCKPEYMERTKWENRFVLLRFWKKNYMMFLKDLKRFKMERLYDKLKAYSESDFYAFHMPGHKRNKALLGIELPYDLDITEIDGFDDLHHADGILKEEQERAARVFGAEESHFLVNGSTAGILSAVMGCTHRGDKILVARHCHKSIYHAIYMNGLVPRYVYPEFDISMHMNGEISKEDVAKALDITVDEEDTYETLNGFLISKIDKIPSEDDRIVVETNGYCFKVLTVENKIIQKVSVTKLSEDTKESVDKPCQEPEKMIK